MRVLSNPNSPGSTLSKANQDDGDILLEVRNLRKYFALGKSFFSRSEGEFIKAVDGVSFSIRKGETLGLVGESGSGKSTIGLAIARLYEATGGDIFFEGSEVSRLKESEFRKNRKSIQIVFQNPLSSLDPSMKIGAIVAEPLRNQTASDKGSAESVVVKLLQHVGLDPSLRDQYPHELSGGQAQRVAIARALSTNPKFLILDEPTSALDVSVQAQIINLLKKLQKDYGLTYLFISHDLGVINYVSNWVAVLYLGRIVELAPVNEIFERPLHPYTQALISSIPSTDSGNRRDKIILTGEIPSSRKPPSGCHFHTRCPIAIEKCTSLEPQLETAEKEIFNSNGPNLDSGEHWVACHRIDESSKNIEKLWGPHQTP